MRRRGVELEVDVFLGRCRGVSGVIEELCDRLAGSRLPYPAGEGK